MCACHVRDISNFLRGIHVTFNARTEEDIDEDIILEKVSRASSTSYKFNERIELPENSQPVVSKLSAEHATHLLK